MAKPQGLEAGSLRERIQFQSRHATRDTIGGEEFTWNDEGEVWAAVEPITGREASIASQTQAITTLKVVCRNRDDVTQTWRIVWRNQILSIEAVLPHPLRDRITVLCSQGLNKADL